MEWNMSQKQVFERVEAEMQSSSSGWPLPPLPEVDWSEHPEPFVSIPTKRRRLNTGVAAPQFPAHASETIQTMYSKLACRQYENTCPIDDVIANGNDGRNLRGELDIHSSATESSVEGGINNSLYNTFDEHDEEDDPSAIYLRNNLDDSVMDENNVKNSATESAVEDDIDKGVSMPSNEHEEEDDPAAKYVSNNSDDNVVDSNGQTSATKSPAEDDIQDIVYTQSDEHDDFDVAAKYLNNILDGNTVDDNNVQNSGKENPFEDDIAGIVEDKEFDPCTEYLIQDTLSDVISPRNEAGHVAASPSTKVHVSKANAIRAGAPDINTNQPPPEPTPTPTYMQTDPALPKSQEETLEPMAITVRPALKPFELNQEEDTRSDRFIHQILNGEEPQPYAPPFWKPELTNPSPVANQAANTTTPASDCETKEMDPGFGYETKEIPNPSKCGDCCKLFEDESALEKHSSRSHAPQAENGSHCPLCFNKVKAGANLRRHVAVCHGPHAKFRCETCSVLFSTKKTLNQHERIVHGKVTEMKATSKKRKRRSDPNPFYIYICKACDYRTPIKGNMIRHVWSIHSDVRPFPCSRCNASFNTKHNRDIHEIEHKNPVVLAETADEMDCEGL